jgi:hypothetical protein
MTSFLDHIEADDGAVIDPEHIPVALTAGTLLFDDGAIQVFDSDGTTTYTEHGRPSAGTWYVEGQAFCSFWPPSYTGCYRLTWLVEGGSITGLRFDDLKNPSQFVGRYQGANKEKPADV